MTTYSQLHQFNDEGLVAFEEVVRGHRAESRVDPLDSGLVFSMEGSTGISIGAYGTAKEMAQCVLTSLGNVKLHDCVSNTGLWAWLTYVLRDTLFDRRSDGTLIAGEACRWYPEEQNSFKKANRHLVRMPVLLLDQFGEDADHMLCGPPREVPKIRYELTRSQGMLGKVFQNVARKLYFDEATGKTKPGASGIEGGGTAYRLAQVFKQLDVAWEIEDLEPEEFMRILPKEFDRFKPNN